MGARVLAGRYELLAKIGEGGMAVVFKAKDRMLDRYVALKILRPEYTTDKNFIAGFLRESQLVAGIVDPNIVQVYDVGNEGNIHYIVMELVEGETLSNIIKREGKLDAHRVVSYGKQIAKALATAHENDLIHRDIKPHNIMITKDGVAKLTDFGIAKRMAPGDNMNSEEKEAVMGSIHYFSPEQARGSNVDERSDIYSLGIVMYEMITGKVPYDGDDAVEVAVKHMNGQMVPPSQIAYDMPQDLEDIILKATAKNPSDRFDSAEDMIYALNFVKYSRLVDNKYVDEVELYQTNSDKPAKKIDANNPDEYDEEEDDEPVRRHTGLLFTTIILIGSLALGLLFFVMNLSGNNKTVSVPDLKGMSYEVAQTELEKLGLNIAVDMQIASSTQTPGTIVSQNVTAGTKVKQGHTIKVNIAKSNENAIVPNVINKNIDEAQTMLINEGFTIGTIESEYSNFDYGVVLSVEPEVGTSKKIGSSVNLVMSLGKDPSETSLCIDVRGLTEEEAKKKITAAGCTVVVQYIAGTGGDDDGKVTRQYPSYNEPVEKGTQFTITVKGVAATSITITPDWSKVTEKKNEDSSKNVYEISIYFTNSTNANSNTNLQLVKTITVKYKETVTAEFTENGYAKVSIDNAQMQNFKIDISAGTATRVK